MSFDDSIPRSRVTALRHGCILATASLVVLVMQGCVSPNLSSSGKTPAIAVSRSGRMSVDGEAAPLAQLGKKLKALGVPTSSPIQVSIQKNTPDSVKATVGRSLIASGYKKFVFVGPKKATAEVSSSTTTASTVSSSSSTVRSKTTTSSTKRKTSSKGAAK